MLSAKFKLPLKIIAIAILLLGVSFFYYKKLNRNLRPILPPESEFVSSYLSFSGKRQYLKIKNTSRILPSAKKDLIVAFWIRFKKQPQNIRAYRLLQKFDEINGQRQGFSFLLERERGGFVRPVVAWYSSKPRREEALRFSELKLSNKTWTLMAFGIKQSRYVLVRAANVKDSKPLQIQNLGAYDLEAEHEVSNAQDFLLGSLGGGGFYGDLGPILMFTGENLIDDFTPIFEQILANPSKLPVLKNQQLEIPVAVFPNQADSSLPTVEYSTKQGAP